MLEQIYSEEGRVSQKLAVLLLFCCVNCRIFLNKVQAVFEHLWCILKPE